EPTVRRKMESALSTPFHAYPLSSPSVPDVWHRAIALRENQTGPNCLFRPKLAAQRGLGSLVAAV
ncbi:MAG: hypothetical protein ACJ8M1_14800, partial [Chthoniobacterales bacterium]